MTFDFDAAIVVLTRMPSVLNALLRDLASDWVRSNEGPDTWSPYDVTAAMCSKACWNSRLRRGRNESSPGMACSFLVVSRTGRER